MKLTASVLRSVLHYDQDTGEFRWIAQASNRRGSGLVAGCLCNKSGYRLIGYKGKVYKASRLAWLYVHGEWPPAIVDHINGDRANDRIANLRLATQAENLRNRGKQKNNTSGFKGVYQHAQNNWRARITKDGRQYCLGLYSTPEEAHRAYAIAAERLHGDFARDK